MSDPAVDAARPPDGQDTDDILLMAAQRPSGIMAILRDIYARGQLAGCREMKDAMMKVLDKAVITLT